MGLQQRHNGFPPFAEQRTLDWELNRVFGGKSVCAKTRQLWRASARDMGAPSIEVAAEDGGAEHPPARLH